MKTIGILLLIFAILLGLPLLPNAGENNSILDALALVATLGTIVLTLGLLGDMFTSQHSNTTKTKED